MGREPFFWDLGWDRRGFWGSGMGGEKICSCHPLLFYVKTNSVCEKAKSELVNTLLYFAAM